MFFSNFSGNSHEQEEEGEEAAKATYNVAVGGEDGFFFVEIEGTGEVSPLPPCGALHNVTPLVYKSADAGVGTAGNAAAVLNCPQTGIIEVLFVTGSIAPPAVVGNDGHHIGAIVGPLTVKIAKYRFITYCGSYPGTAPGFKQGTLFLGTEITYSAGNTPYQFVHKFERTALERIALGQNHKFGFMVVLRRNYNR